MKILSVSELNPNDGLSFRRKPTQQEFKVYSASVKKGLKVLDKELGMIIHNSSLPSQKGQNLGIGSMLSKATAGLFAPFLASQAVTKIQQDPNYIRRESDPSPYDPISTSKNIYMIPLEKLASKDYGFLVKSEDLKKIYSPNDEKVNYDIVHKNYNDILKVAYNNFYALNYDKSKQEEMSEDFIEFKSKNWDILEPNALYELLANIHKTENWKEWPNKDKYLYENADYSHRLELVADNIKQIDFHIFKQWLVEREIERSNKENAKLGIRVIADTPIAFTPAEEWLNKDLFLDDIALGCPPDFYSKDGQRWGFAVLNPKKIFNEDGSLGKGGEFLKKRYEEIFKASPGGVRIDHLIGLIDPFVYKESEPHMNWNNSGRLYSSPHVSMLKKYSKNSIEDYSALFDKIILPAASKYGLTQDDILCEDLGDKTYPVQKVMEKFKLTGLWLTQFGYNGADAPKNSVIMMGAHDNQSFLEYTDSFFYNSAWGQGRDNFMRKTHTLAADTMTFEKDENDYREKLRSDKKEFLKASFAELFTSPAKKVQVFFTDFFGINKTYNVPGSKKDCWTLRLPSNWEELYYENLKKGLAFNIPEALSTAIKHRGQEFAQQHKGLLENLDKFAKILKE